MKKLIIALFAASTLVASAATLKENIDSGNYSTACQQLQYGTNSLHSVANAQNAVACYNAAIAQTNVSAAGIAASIALWYNDKETFVRFLDYVLENYEKNTNCVSSLNMTLFGQSTFDPECTGKGKLKLLNFAGNEIVHPLMLNRLYPSMMLSFYKRCMQARNYELASYAFNQCISRVENGQILWCQNIAEYIDDEWKAFLDSFTSLQLAQIKNDNNQQAAYLFVNTMKKPYDEYISDAFVESYIKNIDAHNRGSGAFLSFGIIHRQKAFDVALTCKNAAIKMFYAQKLDQQLGNNEASLQVMNDVVADKNISFAKKLNFALNANDNNAIIDIALQIGNDTAAADINKLIPILNGLDAGYRTADIKKILTNINKKYTIKLYDDRDTWEPILSKVRAMLEVIE